MAEPHAPDDRTLGLSASELLTVGQVAGLDAIAITHAGPFTDTLHDLGERKAAGLHGGMEFTYRNPERSTDPQRILPGARSLVVGAFGYRRADAACEAGSAWDEGAGRDKGSGPGAKAGTPTPAPARNRPTGRIARYARSDHYASLRAALDEVAAHLRRQGWQAVVVCDDNALVDRAAAHRAGLGWFGKNTLLLLHGLGSWYVLGTVVTDAPLVREPADAPLVREPAGAPIGLPARRPIGSSARPPTSSPAQHGEGCSSCTRCMTACPTGALVAPGQLDARRCLAWLVQAPGSFPVEFRAALGDRIYGCDACQEVCPINKVADRRHLPQPADRAERSTVDLLDLLAASDEELLRRHGRWYIARRDPRYVRRNALVALGNVGDGRDPAVAGALGRALAGPDPLLREHAAWAAERLGRSDLVAGR